MKRINLIAALLLGTIAFTGCEKDNMDVDRGGQVSEKAKQALTEKYPDATNITWISKGEYVVANFSLPVMRSANTSGNDHSAWFDNSGDWYMTETEIPYTALPEAVKSSFQNSEYKDWEIDDIDMLEREGVETIYVIEVEGMQDRQEIEIDLYYTADGVLTKKVVDSDPDYDYEDYIPSKLPNGIEEYIRAHYPNARILDIDTEDGMTEIEILDGSSCIELLFDRSGTWIYSKTEVEVHEVPTVVMQALTAEYASYYIDDIDFYQTGEGSYYRFDLESASGDIKIDITPDGAISVVKPDKNPGNGQMLDSAIADFIAEKYNGAVILEFDYDDGWLEVEIIHENREKDLYFNGAGKWIRTEWDIRYNELPETVKTAITASEWAAYSIDDIEYVQTPAEEYYRIELESGKQEITLKITESGNIL